MAAELRSPGNSGPPKARLKGKIIRYNFANMPRNSANAAWTGQGGPTWFIWLTDASVTIRGNVTPLRGITQLGVRHRIEGKAPKRVHNASRDVKLGNGHQEGGKSLGGGCQQKTLQQPRLKRKRAKEETRRPKDGGLSDRGKGRGERKNGGSGGADRRNRRQSAVVSSKVVVSSDIEESGDGLDDLDDLDDLEKELEEMDDNCDSTKAGSGEDASGRSEEDEESDGAESDGSIGAATLEIERFLESMKGEATGGKTFAAEESRVLAAGEEEGGEENVSSCRAGASGKALERELVSSGYNSTLPQGTKGLGCGQETLKVGNNCKGVHVDGARRESGAEDGENDRSAPEKHRVGGTASVAPELCDSLSPKKNKPEEKEEDVDSDLEGDLDEILEEVDEVSDPELDLELVRAKGDNGSKAREEGRGSDPFALDEEGLEDVSSYSEEESGDEDAVGDIEDFLARI